MPVPVGFQRGVDLAYVGECVICTGFPGNQRCAKPGLGGKDTIWTYQREIL